MTKNRSFTTYIFLNALTLGIYGLVVKSQMSNEINTYCNGDGAQPRFGFIGAWLLDRVAGGVYLPSWWYAQTKRLYANGVRYDMTIRETPLQQYAWMLFVSSFSKVLAVPFMLIVAGVSVTLMGGVIGGVAVGAMDIFEDIFDYIPVMSYFDAMGSLAFFLVPLVVYFINFVIVLFASFDMYYIIKDVNRYADAAMSVSPADYDPMVIPEVDNSDNIFSRAVEIADTISVDTLFAKGEASDGGNALMTKHLEADIRRLQGQITNLQSQLNSLNSAGGGSYKKGVVNTPPVNESFANVVCRTGANKGTILKVSSEKELIIGKDPATCQCIIPASYKSVSRKHCGLRYDKKNDRYFITDYSTNGTFANGKKLPQNSTVAIKKGVIIKLGDTDNEFMLQ
ncbi:MAG: FHA domain-containing protein [Clostridia bacterium]|nr:FHA domain-containing protein [Clostridia bacterium]